MSTDYMEVNQMQFANQNYYPQMQQQNYNPYIDRMNYLQQYQQNLQQPLLPTQMSGANQFTPLGKMVDSVEVVKATDIPMDGNVYYFPKADGSVVYGKQWLPNGTTKILSFKAVSEEGVESPASDLESLKTAITNELTDIFMDKFDDITNSLKRLERSIRPVQVKPKKEVNVDE